MVTHTHTPPPNTSNSQKHTLCITVKPAANRPRGLLHASVHSFSFSSASGSSVLSSVQYFKSIDGGRVSFSVPINEPGSARDNCCSLKTAARACYLRLVPVTTERTGSERSNLETLETRQKSCLQGKVSWSDEETFCLPSSRKNQPLLPPRCWCPPLCSPWPSGCLATRSYTISRGIGA